MLFSPSLNTLLTSLLSVFEPTSSPLVSIILFTLLNLLKSKITEILHGYVSAKILKDKFNIDDVVREITEKGL